MEPGSLDLDAYLERIACAGKRTPSASALESLHLAHLAAIPFENIDVRLGRSIRLDLESLQAKLVKGGRGGYCFEQNTLFAAALRALGFDVETLEARVRPPGATATLPRTHMLLRVVSGRVPVLADVGFGGDGPMLPVPLDGSVSEQPEGAYRVETEPSGAHVLRRRWRDEWRDLYAFSLTPALAVDFEVGNHYTSTHPGSVFRKMLTIQKSAAGARHILRDRLYTIRRGGEEAVRELSVGEVPSLVRDCFGLDVSEQEIFDALGEPAAAG